MIALNALERYLDGLRISASPIHVRTQRRYVGQYLIWANIKNLDAITEGSINSFILSRQESGRYSATTLRNHICGLRLFLNWCVKKHFLGDNPAKQIKLPRATKRLPKALTPEQARTLLSTSQGEIKTVMAFALYAGLRRSEIFRLRWEDIDFKAGLIRLHKTKAHAPQSVPLSDHLRELLWPFRKPEGRICAWADLSWKAFRKAMIAAGIKTTFHALRHTFATNLLMNHL